MLNPEREVSGEEATKLPEDLIFKIGDNYFLKIQDKHVTSEDKIYFISKCFKDINFKVADLFSYLQYIFLFLYS